MIHLRNKLSKITIFSAELQMLSPALHIRHDCCGKASRVIVAREIRCSAHLSKASEFPAKFASQLCAASSLTLHSKWKGKPSLMDICLDGVIPV
jgi:hypothetical protein